MNNLLNHLLAITILLLSSFALNAQLDCSVNAGIGDVYCPGEEISLNGNVTGAFDPTTICWKVVSQPTGADVSIVDPSALITQTDALAISGDYEFSIQAMCSEELAIQTVTHTVVDITEPIFDVPADQICWPCGESIIVEGVALQIDEVSLWRVESPDGVSVYGTKIDENHYELHFPCQGTDCPVGTEVEVSYRVISPLGCFKESRESFSISIEQDVFADNEFNACDTLDCANLFGLCDIDGNGSWRIIEQPTGSNAAIGDIQSNNTEICGLVEGIYLLEWSVSNECESGADTTEIAVAYILADTLPLLRIDPTVQAFCPGGMPDSVLLSGNDIGPDFPVLWKQTAGVPVTLRTPEENTTWAVGLTQGENYRFSYNHQLEADCFSQNATGRIISLQDDGFDINPCVNKISFGTAESTMAGLHSTIAPYRYDSLDLQISLISYPINFDEEDRVKLMVEHVPGLSSGINRFRDTTFVLGGGANEYRLYNVQGTTLFQFVNSYILSASHVGYYTFQVDLQSPCSDLSLEMSVFYNDFINLPNAGTDQILDCGQDSTVLAGNLENGFWFLLKGPENAPNPIQGEYIGDNLVINDLHEGNYEFIYSNYELDGGCDLSYNSDTVHVVMSNELPRFNNVADTSSCLIDPFCLLLPEAENALLSNIALLTGNATVSINMNQLCITDIEPEENIQLELVYENGCGMRSDSFTISWLGTLDQDAVINTPDSCWGIFTNPLQLSADPASGGFWTFIGTGTPNFDPSDQSPEVSVWIDDFILGEEYFQFVWTIPESECGIIVSDTVTLQNQILDPPILDPILFECFTQFPDTIYIPVESNIEADKHMWNVLSSSFPIAPTLWSNDDGGAFYIFHGPGEYAIQIAYSIDGICNLAPLSDQIWIKLAEGPTAADAGPDQIECTSEFQLAANGEVGDGYWTVLQTVPSDLQVSIADTLDPNSLVTVAQKGIVNLLWQVPTTDPSCGPDSEDIVQLEFASLHIPGIDTTLCELEDSILLLAVECVDEIYGHWTVATDNENPIVAFNTDTTLLISNLESGEYTLYFELNENAPECFISDSIFIQILPQEGMDQIIDMIQLCQDDDLENSVLCLPENQELMTLELTDTAGGNPEDFTIEGEGSKWMITPALGIGTHEFVASYMDGECVFTEAILLEITALPDFHVTGDTVVCVGDIITLMLEGATETEAIIWLDGMGNEIGSGTTLSFEATETMVISAAGSIAGICDFSFSTMIIVQDLMSALSLTANPPEISLGDSSQLSIVNPPEWLEDINWSPENSISDPSIIDPFAFPESSTLYTLTYSDGICFYSQNIELIVSAGCIEDVYLPNVFSPNGDGINDEFKFALGTVTNFSLLIADRWGEIVYSSMDPASCWNGQYKGVNLSPDVYGYILRFDCGDQPFEFVGNVTIIK